MENANEKMDDEQGYSLSPSILIGFSHIIQPAIGATPHGTPQNFITTTSHRKLPTLHRIHPGLVDSNMMFGGFHPQMVGFYFMNNPKSIEIDDLGVPRLWNPPYIQCRNGRCP